MITCCTADHYIIHWLLIWFKLTLMMEGVKEYTLGNLGCKLADAQIELK